MIKVEPLPEIFRLQLLTLPATSTLSIAKKPLAFGSIKVPVTTTGAVVPGVNVGTVTFTFSAAVTRIAASPVPVSCVVKLADPVDVQLGAVVSAGAALQLY